MKNILPLILTIQLIACTNKTQAPSDNSIEGTWQLISGTLIEKGDTTVTLYNKNVSFIKILNKSHFAFFQHDLNKGQDSSAIFVSGGGKYSLLNNTYTEHLEYCSARNWEGNDFNFIISIKNDTLIQTGVEKVEALGINRLNIEKYVRLSR